MLNAVPFTDAEKALLTAAGWECEADDPCHHGVSELAYQTYWGMGGFPCDCCNFGVEAILTKYEDSTIVGTFTMSDAKDAPWVVAKTVEEALEAYKTASYFKEHP